jgi:hypothetical protein
MDARTKFILPLVIAVFGLPLAAHAKCSIRVGDNLITRRYKQCNPRTFLSYLYNDLVTPYSFTCAKKLSATCRKENCDRPETEEDKERCLGRFVAVLDECTKQIDDAARMARCTDTKAWPVLASLAGRPSPRRSAVRIEPGTPVLVPDLPLDIPVTVEPLPPEAFQVERKTTRTTQSSRRR